jgi:hypothetical protein
MNGLPWTNDVATYKLIYLRTQARLFTVIGFRVMFFFKPKLKDIQKSARSIQVVTNGWRKAEVGSRKFATPEVHFVKKTFLCNFPL